MRISYAIIEQMIDSYNDQLIDIFEKNAPYMATTLILERGLKIEEDLSKMAAKGWVTESTKEAIWADVEEGIEYQLNRIEKAIAEED